MKVRDITHVATLTAVSIILGIIESYIPSIGIPGVKLGLATALFAFIILLAIANEISLLPTENVNVILLVVALKVAAP